MIVKKSYRFEQLRTEGIMCILVVTFTKRRVIQFVGIGMDNREAANNADECVRAWAESREEKRSA